MVSAPAAVVIGGGWAGLAAAVAATRAGWRVTLLEASRHWGGRARRLTLPDGRGGRLPLDNGQHILIGACGATLGLLEALGVPWQRHLQRLPLALPRPDGTGLILPGWATRMPAPLALAATLLTARGWGWGERAAALGRAARWMAAGFTCPPQATVADLCTGLPARVVDELIEPLAVAALNTAPATACGTTFLRVLRDALRAPAPAGLAPSDLLLPRGDLGALLPDAATAWLAARGAELRLGARALALARRGGRWHVHLADGAALAAEAVILATPAPEAARLVSTWAGDPACPAPEATAVRGWAAQAKALAHVPIATIYARAPRGWRWRWPQPMLALPNEARPAPAQFVFHRGENTAAADGALLAAVVSSPDPSWDGDREGLAAAVTRQLAAALACPGVQALATLVERRATFACTPGLRRPAAHIAAGLLAAGDYVAGPYPATLEGAVRSGLAAVEVLRGDPLA
ncbi:HpnE: squalene-associated FAD-dependent desaturase [Tepidimonas sediminis]|uniref:HpnE: squalene-associated FAD-dependent desaturase n=1 Tax=Tepidimonas sediminis TaxID=2588941 RepID=A0A554WSB4_9BURK|nr:HpnE: squalene-associated FAD-dependent desaturase [Tepidimonas sediminis]